MVGDPHCKGFGQTGWWFFKGEPGPVVLYNDARGVVVTATLALGGFHGKSATFIRAVTVESDEHVVTLVLAMVKRAWSLDVAATGRPGGLVTTISETQATIDVSYLNVRVAQRQPKKPAAVQDPMYGNWLDVYLTIKSPLPMPVGGLLGSTYTPRRSSAAVSTEDGSPTFSIASIGFDE